MVFSTIPPLKSLLLKPPSFCWQRNTQRHKNRSINSYSANKLEENNRNRFEYRIFAEKQPFASSGLRAKLFPVWQTGEMNKIQIMSAPESNNSLRS